MKESKDRTEQFMYSAASAANQAPTSAHSVPTSFLGSSHEIAYLDSVLFQQHNDPMGDGSSFRQDSKGKGRAVSNGDVLALDLGSAEEGTGGRQNGGAFMQMELVEQQVCILRLFRYDAYADMAIGLLHPITVNSYRIHRIDYRRARTDLYTISEYGCRTTRNCTTYRCRHHGHCVECQRGATGAVEVLC